MGKPDIINWIRFKELAAKLIEYQAKMTRIPIRAESWEEVIYAVLLYMEYEVSWDPTSHAKGVDLEVKIGEGSPDQQKVTISAKGGKINNGTLSLSSYRLTRFRSLAGMLEFLKRNAEEIDAYLICAREEQYEHRIYNIFKVTPSALIPDTLLDPKNWEETDQAWVLAKHVGFEARIVKNMSNQLWYSIPSDFPHLEQLSTIKVSKSEMGSMLHEILKSFDQNESHNHASLPQT